MLSNGAISQSEFSQAKDEYIKLNQNQSSRSSKKAPHFVDFILNKVELSDLPQKIITTLDLGIQNRVENIIQSDITFLDKFNIKNAAAVILDVKNGDILAMVGSADYENEEINGEVNITTSLRQSGSSIKPLVYATALESGWSADTIIVDEPVQFDTVDGLPYSPKNFDLTYHGAVTVAEALAQSLNIPAVKTMDYVGAQSFLQIAESFGITTFDKSSAHYGLSLALGSGEVKLLELANAYSTFANDGNRADIRFIKSVSENQVGQSGFQNVISSKTANVISAILSSNDLRMPAFGEENPLKLSFRVAAKTGTTRNFRDNWTIGYTDDYVVGIWVGNASGEVMEGVSGISGAGPIFYKIMNMLHEKMGTVLTAGEDVKLPVTSVVIGGDQAIGRFRGHEGQSDSIQDFRIISPFANDLYQYDPNKPSGYQKIQLQASEKAKWYVDGRLVGEGKEVLWRIVRGHHQIKAVNDGEERVVAINVR